MLSGRVCTCKTGDPILLLVPHASSLPGALILLFLAQILHFKGMLSVKEGNIKLIKIDIEYIG